jgi:hypothetical protein
VSRARPRAGALVVRAWVEEATGLRARITYTADVENSEVTTTSAGSEEEIFEAVREWLAAIGSDAPNSR